MSDRFFKHPAALVDTDQIGDHTNVWAYAHVMKGAVVGSHCNIGDHAFIETGAVVGDEVTIKNGVAVWQYVTVKNRVFLGPNCSLTNDMRPRSKRDWTPVATTIEEGASIGANATIVCGCDIGRYAFVGAGSVVTKPVPAHALVYGSPARVRGYVCECCQPLSGKGTLLVCPKCGLRYAKTKQGVVRAETAPEQPARGIARKPAARNVAGRTASRRPAAKRSVRP